MGVHSEIKIAFGLSQDPTEDQINSWVTQTEIYLRQGYSLERAAKYAAARIFPSYGTCVYASEGETLKTLLMRARGK